MNLYVIISEAMPLQIPQIIHTKDKEGNLIDKICARDFWRGRNSYRDFQKETNTFIDPIKQIKHEEREKEWDLER